MQWLGSIENTLFTLPSCADLPWCLINVHKLNSICAYELPTTYTTLVDDNNMLQHQLFWSYSSDPHLSSTEQLLQGWDFLFTSVEKHHYIWISAFMELCALPWNECERLCERGGLYVYWAPMPGWCTEVKYTHPCEAPMLWQRLNVWRCITLSRASGSCFPALSTPTGSGPPGSLAEVFSTQESFSWRCQGLNEWASHANHVLYHDGPFLMYFWIVKLFTPRIIER